MNAALAYALLPWIIIGSTALILMLFAAVKRDHLYISFLTSLGLLLALIVQLIQISEVDYKDSLVIFDGTTTLLSALIIFVSFLLSLLLYPWLESVNDPKEEYYMLFLLATLGSLVVCASSHFASFFLGLELMSLSLVPMVSYVDRDQKSLEAGIKYLVLSALASAFMLMAIAIIYFYAGTLSIDQIVNNSSFILESSATSGEGLANTVIYNTALVFLLVGVTFKLSLAPCHLWVADLLEGSPLPTAALLATISKAAMFVVLIRLFSFGDWHLQTDIVWILSAVAGVSMIMGNFLALLQKNILRLLAFSSIAHFGYLLLTLISMKPESALANESALSNEAAIYYLFAYLITVLGTFAVLMLLNTPHTGPQKPSSAITIDSLRGLFWNKPGTSLTLMLLLLSLAGIPLTIGFVGKFYVTLAAVNSQLWYLVAALIISSIAGLYYYLRLIMIMVEKTDAGESLAKEPFSVTSPILLTTVSSLVLGIGIFPGHLAEIIEKILT